MGEVKKTSGLAYPGTLRLSAASSDLKRLLEPKTSQTYIQELEEAEKIIVRNIQHQTYPEEYCNLESSKGPLAKLKPFMKERLLRVRGQLNQSELDYNAKRPMILPGKHRITDMITLYYHLANGHVGPHPSSSRDTAVFLDRWWHFLGQMCCVEMS